MRSGFPQSAISIRTKGPSNRGPAPGWYVSVQGAKVELREVEFHCATDWAVAERTQRYRTGNGRTLKWRKVP